MTNSNLEVFANNTNLPKSIRDKIIDVLNEDENYAADEIVILGEEILNQTAAIGIASYLSQANQKEVYNDFLLELFTINYNSYNAGPLFRWAANMIKGLEDSSSKSISSIFWNGNVLNSDFNNLSKLRNEVMHGFFVLPSKRNIAEAKKISELLDKMIKINVFNKDFENLYHFLKVEDGVCFFNHNWQLGEDDWKNFEKSFSFGELAMDIRYETSNSFIEDQKNFINENLGDFLSPEETLSFVEKNSKGALSVLLNPSDNLNRYYSNVVNALENEKYLKVFYSCDSHGINTTSEFFLNYFLKKLILFKNESVDFKQLTGLSSIKKRIVKELVKIDKKTVVILNNIHINLFNKDHVLNLKDFFYENNVLLVCIGHNYTWLKRYFNKRVRIGSSNYFPNEKEAVLCLNNYLRFKGPSKEIEFEKKDYDRLREILRLVLKTLIKKKELVARRFADENQYPVEYVLEIFEAISPYFEINNCPFEKPEKNLITNQIENINESSRIYFTIDRYDASLEYLHKKIKP